MSLLESEVYRLRAELGYNVMGISALPYIGITPIFDSVIQQYINQSAITESSTTLDATNLPYLQATIIVASMPATLVRGVRVIIDVDDLQEAVTVRSIVSSTSFTALIKNSHSGTYPITVEGGESIIREKMAQLRAVNGPGGQLETAMFSAGIKAVDEIQFFGGMGAQSEGVDALTQAIMLQELYRDELASFLGIGRKNRLGGGGYVEAF